MKKIAFLTGLFSFVLLLSISMSCKKDSNNNAAKPTLYDSLGGTTMVADPGNAGKTIEKGRLLIRNIIDSTIFVIAGDSKINSHFTVLLSEVQSGNLSGFQALSKNLTDFVAVGTGAKNFTYTGDDMKTAHDPAKNPRMNGKASDADFTQFEVDLVAGANKAGVPSNNPALQSVAKIVESLRSVVVQQ